MNASKPIRAIARGLEVIDALNERHSTPMHVLSKQTGMPRATLLRILKTLHAAGWVYRYRANGNYRLTSEVCRLGEHLLTADRLAEMAAPIMDRLHEELRCPADIAICNGRDMRVLESTGRETLKGSRRNRENLLGSTVPMLCSALGLAYLAFCSATERQVILASLIDDAESADRAEHGQLHIHGLLSATRARGYAQVMPGECAQHVDCGRELWAIAVPVTVDRQVRACLGVLWPEELASVEPSARHWLPPLSAAAREIAEDLRRQSPKSAP